MSLCGIYARHQKCCTRACAVGWPHTHSIATKLACDSHQIAALRESFKGGGGGGHL